MHGDLQGATEVIWANIQQGIVRFPSANLTENTGRYYEIYSVLLPVCMATTALKAIWKCRSRFLMRFQSSFLRFNL
jgi:hypothetical protein